MSKWIFDGHPQRYHVAALLFSFIAIILVQQTERFTATATTGVACTYTYGSWSPCQSDSKRYRSVITQTPDGCVQATAPTVSESCNYTADVPATTACTYTYGSWGDCMSGGRRYRSVITQTPVGCVQTAAPYVSESCNYTADATASTPTSTTACTYTYGSWGSCQSDSKRYRSVITQTPDGCVQATAPTVSESCNYTATATTACTYTYGSWGSCQSDSKRYRSVITQTPDGCVQATAPTVSESCAYTATDATASTTTSATACAYTYSSWGACQEHNKRIREVTSKLPVNCIEYTEPAVEQSCVYESAIAATAPISATSSSGATTSAVAPVVTTTTHDGAGVVTPIFFFCRCS